MGGSGASTLRTSIVVLVVLTVIGTGGCSNGSDDAAPRDDSFTIENEDGRIAVGTAELPDGWPSDFPLSDDFSLTSSSSMNSAGVFATVLGTSETGPDDIISFYEGSLDGWTMQNETTLDQDGRIHSAEFVNGDQSALVSATEVDGRTELTVIYRRAG